MSTGPATANNSDRTPAAELQTAARDAYRQGLRDGEPLTGAKLGDRFSRSARWGRARIAEAHTERQAAITGTATTASPARQPDPADRDDAEPTGDESPSRGEAAITRADAHVAVLANGASSSAAVLRRLADEPPRRRAPEPQFGRSDGGHTVGKGQSVGGTRHGHAPAGEAAAKLETAVDVAEVAVSPAIRRTTTLAVLAVAIVAAVASFDHQRVLADMAGEGWRSWLLPISVDGLVVAASMSLLVHRRAQHPAAVSAHLLAAR